VALIVCKNLEESLREGGKKGGGIPEISLHIALYLITKTMTVGLKSNQNFAELMPEAHPDIGKKEDSS